MDVNGLYCPNCDGELVFSHHENEWDRCEYSDMLLLIQYAYFRCKKCGASVHEDEAVYPEEDGSLYDPEEYEDDDLIETEQDAPLG